MWHLIQIFFFSSNVKTCFGDIRRYANKPVSSPVSSRPHGRHRASQSRSQHVITAAALSLSQIRKKQSSGHSAVILLILHILKRMGVVRLIYFQCAH